MMSNFQVSLNRMINYDASVNNNCRFRLIPKFLNIHVSCRHVDFEFVIYCFKLVNITLAKILSSAHNLWEGEKNYIMNFQQEGYSSN